MTRRKKELDKLRSSLAVLENTKNILLGKHVIDLSQLDRRKRMRQHRLDAGVAARRGSWANGTTASALRGSIDSEDDLAETEPALSRLDRGR